MGKKDPLEVLKEHLAKELIKDNIKEEKSPLWGEICPTCKRAKSGPRFEYAYCQCSKRGYPW